MSWFASLFASLFAFAGLHLLVLFGSAWRAADDKQNRGIAARPWWGVKVAALSLGGYVALSHGFGARKIGKDCYDPNTSNLAKCVDRLFWQAFLAFTSIVAATVTFAMVKNGVPAPRIKQENHAPGPADAVYIMDNKNQSEFVSQELEDA
ncbi:hypothetical protein K461DRAFT_129006 [Myriangium duriaei CBS 260.36]|uniref:Uncharacterized protein n=1 Tax=Myriangium duriaei CBS 260.36 TaxID=1168546 RepID=A0A9P4MH65_9PEZI|nr:hypothetical protein K461DRAFT_129006 [Myriangium duriaei CBS 260.36]